MQDLVSGWPVWVTFVVLFLGALARGIATNLLGRGLRRGGERSRHAARLDRPALATAERWVARVGAPAVSLGFLTVGVQTLINLSAGMLRMPWSRFLPAVIVGAALWAALYTWLGFAVMDALLGRVPWWWLLIAAGVVVLMVAVSRLVASRWRHPTR